MAKPEFELTENLKCSTKILLFFDIWVKSNEFTDFQNMQYSQMIVLKTQKDRFNTNIQVLTFLDNVLFPS